MSTIHLTPSLREGAADQAVTVLQAYYAPLSSPRKGFSGGQFDTFDPSGTRAASPDIFTAEDLIAVSLLSVHVTGRAALELLEHQSGRFSELLRTVGEDRDLVEVESTAADRFPLRALNNALRQLPGVGPTTASKLLARKRPKLVPIYDSVIDEHLLRRSGRLWEPVRLALRAEDRRLHRYLLELRDAAQLGEHVSAIRVLDVLAWMDGSRNTDRVLAKIPIPEDDDELVTTVTM